MGCCASDRKNRNLSQQRALQQQFAASNYHNPKLAASTEFGKVFRLQNPRQGHKYYKRAIEVQASNFSQPEGASKAQRAGFVAKGGQEGYKNESKMVQSAIEVVCSSDRKEHSPGLSQLHGINFAHQLQTAQPRAKNPSSRKVEFIKASTQSSLNQKIEDNLKSPGNSSPKLRNENQSKMVGHGNVGEMVHAGKENGSQLQLKVHGEEQVLQSYQQYFELPIFEVALAAH